MCFSFKGSTRWSSCPWIASLPCPGREASIYSNSSSWIVKVLGWKPRQGTSLGGARYIGAFTESLLFHDERDILSIFLETVRMSVNDRETDLPTSQQCTDILSCINLTSYLVPLNLDIFGLICQSGHTQSTTGAMTHHDRLTLARKVREASEQVSQMRSEVLGLGVASGSWSREWSLETDGCDGNIWKLCNTSSISSTKKIKRILMWVMRHTETDIDGSESVRAWRAMIKTGLWVYGTVDTKTTSMPLCNLLRGSFECIWFSFCWLTFSLKTHQWTNSITSSISNSQRDEFDQLRFGQSEIVSAWICSWPANIDNISLFKDNTCKQTPSNCVMQHDHAGNSHLWQSCFVPHTWGCPIPRLISCTELGSWDPFALICELAWCQLCGMWRINFYNGWSGFESSDLPISSSILTMLLVTRQPYRQLDPPTLKTSWPLRWILPSFGRSGCRWRRGPSFRPLRTTACAGSCSTLPMHCDGRKRPQPSLWSL